MPLSSVEINNPVYEPIFEPHFQRERTWEYLEDAAGNEFKIYIEYHYYGYCGHSWIVWCGVKILTETAMPFESILESVKDIITNLENNREKYECKPVLLS